MGIRSTKRNPDSAEPARLQVLTPWITVTMPPKPRTNWALWGKMLGAGAICCIGGPALVIWVSPTEEELFQKYNPELQKRSLENRLQKQEDFDHFAMKLREYSKRCESGKKKCGTMASSLCLEEVYNEKLFSHLSQEGGTGGSRSRSE